MGIDHSIWPGGNWIIHLRHFFRIASGKSSGTGLNKYAKSEHADDVASVPQEPLSLESTQQLRKRGPNSEDMCNTDDADFWWVSTAPTLRTLMLHAGYNDETLENGLKVFDEYVVGSMGPRPQQQQVTTRWRSFMTDDFTPVEFSWNWGSARKQVKPMVRFSIEPIDSQSGSTTDPWNMNASVNLIQRLERNVAGIDNSIYQSLQSSLDSITKTDPVISSLPGTASPSAMFLAFELKGDVPMIKIYMLPFRCLSTLHGSYGDTTVDFLVPFAHQSGWNSLINLLNFLRSDAAELGIEPFMIAFDCVAMSRTRMKIYVRSPDTSFRGVRRIMSLFQDTSKIDTAFEDLEELWHLVFGVDPRSNPDSPLMSKEHETSGILYYLEVRPGSEKVTMKVYLPIKHYASDDRSAAQGLAAFMRRVRGPEDESSRKFLSALEEICKHRGLGEGLGLQTYLSCAIKQGELDVTSYINPEVYHPGRMRYE